MRGTHGVGGQVMKTKEFLSSYLTASPHIIVGFYIKSDLKKLQGHCRHMMNNSVLDRRENQTVG